MLLPRGPAKDCHGPVTGADALCAPMSPCLSPSLPSAPSPWALLASLRSVLVVGARSPQLDVLAQSLRRGGFSPELAHTGEAALRRLVEEPIPSLVLVYGASQGSALLLRELQHAGLLGWFSLVLVGEDEAALPAGVQAQAQLPGDCSPAQLLAVLERLGG